MCNVYNLARAEFHNLSIWHLCTLKNRLLLTLRRKLRKPWKNNWRCHISIKREHVSKEFWFRTYSEAYQRICKSICGAWWGTYTLLQFKNLMLLCVLLDWHTHISLAYFFFKFQLCILLNSMKRILDHLVQGRPWDLWSPKRKK